MRRAQILNTFHRFVITLSLILSFSPLPSDAADILILGNTKLRPVTDVLNGIEQTLSYQKSVKYPQNISQNLSSVVASEDAKVVIALGKEAVYAAQNLPEHIPVIYGLIINPLETERENITGVYMTTPVEKYLDFIRTYFPDIKKVGIVCSQRSRMVDLGHGDRPEIMLCSAENPFEFIEGLNTLGNEVDALLLLPERKLITSKVIQQLYLFSFKEKKPVIGISEKYVKIGSLFSLGFDTTHMGRQLGKLANLVYERGSATDIPHSSPDRLNLYINKKTSKTMKVDIPPKLMKTATKVYP